MNEITKQDVAKNLAAMASVDAAIVRVILPQTYQFIDRLIDFIGFENVPKDLRTDCQKILPDQYRNSFVSKKAQKTTKT
jgi:hypothetical protein